MVIIILAVHYWKQWRWGYWWWRQRCRQNYPGNEDVVGWGYLGHICFKSPIKCWSICQVRNCGYWHFYQSKSCLFTTTTLLSIIGNYFLFDVKHFSGNKCEVTAINEKVLSWLIHYWNEIRYMLLVCFITGTYTCKIILSLFPDCFFDKSKERAATTADKWRH